MGEWFWECRQGGEEEIFLLNLLVGSVEDAWLTLCFFVKSVVGDVLGGDPYKPSFPTVTVRGPYPRDVFVSCFPKNLARSFPIEDYSQGQKGTKPWPEGG